MRSTMVPHRLSRALRGDPGGMSVSPAAVPLPWNTGCSIATRYRSRGALEPPGRAACRPRMPALGHPLFRGDLIRALGAR
jgi:hypothetical protein